MKNLFNVYLIDFITIITLIIIGMVFYYVYDTTQIRDVCKYNESVVVDKSITINNEYIYQLKKDGEFITIFISKHDYNSYELGDTIKCKN